MKATFYKGEDITLSFSSKDSLAGYTTKVVKYFTFGSAVKTATVTVLDNYRFTAKLAAADTSDLKAGALNIVLELSNVSGKLISKTIEAKLYDAYVDGGEREANEYDADVVFVQGQEIEVNFSVTPEHLLAQINDATAAAQEATELALDAAETVNETVLSAGELGAIAHNAAAPTPGRTGNYVLSSGGVCSWIPGSPIVKPGDRVVVNFTAPSTHTYTHIVNAGTLSDSLTAGGSGIGASSEGLRKTYAGVDKLNQLAPKMAFGKNRYDKTKATTSAKVLNSSGVVVDGWGGGAVTGFIKIDAGQTLKFANGAPTVVNSYHATYDESYRLVRAIPATDSTTSITQQGIEEYVRITFVSGYINSFVVADNSVSDMSYEPFKMLVKDEDLSQYISRKVEVDKLDSLFDTTVPVSFSVPQKLISASDGSAFPYGNGVATDYIEVSSQNKLRVKNCGYSNANHACIAFYDTNKAYISGSAVAVTGTYLNDTGILTTPANSKYIRMSYQNGLITGVPYLLCGNTKYLSDRITSLEAEIITKAESTDVSYLQEFSAIKIFGKNRFDKTKRTANGTIIDSNGLVVGGNGNCTVTGFIQIDSLQTLKWTLPLNGAVFNAHHATYDANYSPVRVIAITDNAITSITQQGTEKYIRLTFIFGYAGSMMVVDDSVTDLTYEEYKLSINKDDLPNIGTKTAIELPIYYIGDSIASQIAGTIIGENAITGREQHNNCVGGESTLDTCARIGCIPYIINPFTIPADTSKIQVQMTSSMDFKRLFDANGNITSQGGSTVINPYGTLDGKLNGVQGTLTFTRSPQKIEFSRQSAGSSIVVDKPAYFVPDFMTHRDGVFVCFMGTNSGWKIENEGWPTTNDINTLVNYFKKIAEWIEPVSRNYLFLGFYMAGNMDAALFPVFEKRMKEEFGFRYYSVREYMKSYAIDDAGLNRTDYNSSTNPNGLSTEEKTALFTNNSIPNWGHTTERPNHFCGDGTHLTTNMSKVISNQVMRRMVELGYIDGFTKINI